MMPLSRRRLLIASLAGLPLLACTDEGARFASVAESPISGGALPSSTPSAETPPPAEAAVPEAATPVPEPTPAPQPARKVLTVILDPGHGGDEVGAASGIAGLPNLVEKDSNLNFAFRLRELLESDGLRVVMTRERDVRSAGPLPPPTSTAGPGGSVGRADLQSRIDIANTSGGDLFISLHSNGSGNAADNGVEMWYCADRDDGPANEVLAQIMLDNVVTGLANYGFRTTNRGIKEDRYFRVRNGRNFHLFVLGPANPDSGHPRALNMPGVLVENLFLSNERDARMLRDPGGREAIAQAMYRGVHQFFELRGG